jgi:hypothetical protein
MLRGIGGPLDEERQLGVGDEPLDADLQPPEFQTGLRCAVSIDGLAFEASFDCGEIVDRDAPAHPAAAELGTSPDGLAEGCRESGRMLQGFHDFEVMAVR